MTCDTATPRSPSRWGCRQRRWGCRQRRWPSPWATRSKPLQDTYLPSGQQFSPDADVLISASPDPRRRSTLGQDPLDDFVGTQGERWTSRGRDRTRTSQPSAWMAQQTADQSSPSSGLRSGNSPAWCDLWAGSPWASLDHLGSPVGQARTPSGRRRACLIARHQAEASPSTLQLLEARCDAPRSRQLLANQPSRRREPRSLGTGVGAQLGKDVRHMPDGGLLTDDEAIRDSPV
jgi:hypothetical protein